MRVKLENDGRIKLSSAQSHVRKLLTHLIPTEVVINLPENVTVDSSNRNYAININDEINFVRESGIANKLQELYDKSDATLNSMFNLGIESDEISRMSVKSKFGSCEKKLISNGLIDSPEQSFSQDICYYRGEFVKACFDKDQTGYTRAYRSTLLSAVSLVECFLQRYIFLVNDGIIQITDQESFNLFIKPGRISDRIDLWMKIFTSTDISVLHNSNEYKAFSEIKKRRNEIVHSREPMIVYKVKDMIKIMNRVMSGIGGLLILLRRYEGRPEYIGFFRRIYNQRRIVIIR